MRNTFNISFGFWILILPFLGVPILWKTILISASGTLLILVGAGPSILKMLKEKPKIQRKKVSPPVQNIPADYTVSPYMQNTEVEKTEEVLEKETV